MTRHASATLSLAAGLALVACATPTPPPASNGHAPASASSEYVDETRARECNDVVAVINRAAEGIDRMGDGGPELSGDDFATMASTLDKAASAVSALALTLPQLHKLARDYVTMARGTASSARAMAEAMRGEDASRIEPARKGLEAAVDPEERIVRDINTFCQTQ
jgi:hypothetical protein